jgi:hypothetical protein
MRLRSIQTIQNKVLSITTLFKDDYNSIPIFYDYYKKQGVEHFYLYYNGTLTNEIKHICDKEDISLIEWDYQYWSDYSEHSIHHAQLGSLHHAIYKYGKDNTEYMIFCDLDEYLHNKNGKLIELVTKYSNIDTFEFVNCWAKMIDDENNQSVFPSNFYSCETNDWNRKKCIHKLNSIKYIDIHGGKDLGYNSRNINTYNVDLKMFHFNKSLNNRVDYTILITIM